MKDQIRIAFIVTKLSNAAPVLYVQSLVNYLIGYADIEVYYFDDVVELKFACPVRRINFTEKVDFSKFDILHSHGFRPDLFLVKNKSGFIGITVSTIHSYIHYDIKSQYNAFVSLVFCKLWIYSLNQKDYVITLSNDMKSYYERYLNKAKIKFIHSGHSLPEILEQVCPDETNLIKSFKGDTILLGVIANLRRQKGINQIIDAISKNGDYSLLVIGDGKVREDLERQAVRNNCFDRCLFLGYKKEAHKYLKFIDVYVMSSYQEGFGLVNLEAALYKKPIVCSNINVFKEIFNESCVSFFDLDSPDSLLAALSKVVNRYKYYIENLYQLVVSHYSTQRMGKEYLSFYQGLKSTDQHLANT